MRTAFSAEMTDFEDLRARYVTLDRDGSLRTHGVARSVYADGTEVIVNFDDEPYAYGDITVPPRDYVIQKA